MKTFATYNIKGGVGKTSAAVNLAALAARDGQRTLLWDLDPQGAATFLFRVRPKVKGGGKALVRGRQPVAGLVKGTDIDNLDLLPADFSYRHLDLVLDHTKKPGRRVAKLLAPLAAEYDVAFLDCAPSISLVSESVIDAVNTLLVPLIPSTLSLRTLDQLTDFLGTVPGDRRPEVVSFFSMVDRRRRLHREVVENLPRERQGIARSVIPGAAIVEQMGIRRMPVVMSHPSSPASLAYAALWVEVQAGAPVQQPEPLETGWEGANLEAVTTATEPGPP